MQMEISIKPNIYTLRLFYEGTYENRDKIGFICTLITLDKDTIILGAALGKLTKEAYKEIAKEIAKLGYNKIRMERKGEWVDREITITDTNSRP